MFEERLTKIEDRLDAIEKDMETVATTASLIRRVVRWAIGAISGSIVAAAVILYHANQKSTDDKIAIERARVELIDRINGIEYGLTEIRSQVKLVLESELNRGHSP